MNKKEKQTLVSEFFARLGRLLSHGVPLLSALEVITTEQVELPVFQKMINRICHSLEIGKTFSDGVREFSFFPESLLVAIAAGEQQGTLDEQLLRLAPSINQGDFPLGELPAEETLDLPEEELATIPELVDDLLNQAFQAGASDLHLDPGPQESKVRFRIDGVLHTQPDSLSSAQHTAVVSRIKILAALDPAERKLPQDGRIITQLKRGSESDEVDLRVSVCRYYYGEKVVIRFLDTAQFPAQLDAIMSQTQIKTVRKWLRKPCGVILVTGPTGAGKTTTAYLMLSVLAQNESINLITVEDPVEMLIPGINQMQINPSIGLTFPAALRSLLRQDPDALYVAEIRDPETALIISKVALTGHLVLSIMHTQDSYTTLQRLVEVGIPRYIIKQIIVGIVAQQLIRLLCPKCKQELSTTERKDIPEPYQSLDFPLYKPRGCAHCAQIGFKGRSALFEIFEPTSSFWKAFYDGASKEALGSTLPEKYQTMNDHGLQLLLEGLTTWSEIDRVRIN